MPSPRRSQKEVPHARLPAAVGRAPGYRRARVGRALVRAGHWRTRARHDDGAASTARSRGTSRRIAGASCSTTCRSPAAAPRPSRSRRSTSSRRTPRSSSSTASTAARSVGPTWRSTKGPTSRRPSAPSCCRSPTGRASRRSCVTASVSCRRSSRRPTATRMRSPTRRRPHPGRSAMSATIISRRKACWRRTAMPGARRAPRRPTDESPTPTLALEVLVDVGNDLYTSQFGSSSPTATQYVASLFGAVSRIYRRDIGVAVLVNQLVIWTTPDPFGGFDSSAQLTAYKSYNDANRVGVVRDTAHLLAHIGDGGIAYRDIALRRRVTATRSATSTGSTRAFRPSAFSGTSTSSATSSGTTSARSTRTATCRRSTTATTWSPAATTDRSSRRSAR